MWFILVIFSLVFAWQSFRSVDRIVISERSQDLRTRIVGARLLNTGHSPYYFKWQPGVSERFLDPLDVPSWEPSRNRVTVTPFLLLTHSSIACLDYKVIRDVWNLFQLFCFLYIVIFFFFSAKSWIRRALVLVSSCLLISITPGWVYHYALGQVYVFYIFVLCLVYQLYHLKSDNGKLLSGVVFGILILLRPPFIMMLIPFLIVKEKSFIKGAVIGFLLASIVSITAGQWEDWKDYYNAMMGKSAVFSAHPLTRAAVTVDTNFSRMKYPQIVEGVYFKQFRYVPIDTSKKIEIKDNRTNNYFSKLRISNKEITVFIFVLLFILLMWFLRKEISTFTEDRLFLVGFLFYMLQDNFLPALRYQYNYIQWVFALLLVCCKTDILKSSYLPLLLIGLCLNLKKISWFPNAFLIGEVFVFISILLILKYENSDTRS